MLPDDQWFTEICEEGGSAFSLKLKSKLHQEKTPYQTIAIYDTETFGHLMIIDGCTMVSQRENFVYHEMMSHPALFTHDNPENVVIIGGGDCGTLREVLRHDKVKSATQIEIDERVTRLAEQYFPELCDANNDSRAHFYFGDGIRWMQQAEDAIAKGYPIQQVREFQRNAVTALKKSQTELSGTVMDSADANAPAAPPIDDQLARSEEHTSELQSH